MKKKKDENAGTGVMGTLFFGGAPEMPSDWYLDEFKIERKAFGEKQGQYEAKIKFRNCEYESIWVNVPQELQGKILAALAETVCKTADDLHRRILADFKVRQEGSDGR